MKSFRDYLREEVIPTALVKDGSIDLHNPAVRENVNILLDGAVAHTCVTPYIALNKVRKILSNFHVELPKKAYMEGDKGVEVYEIHQFGHKMGMNNDGEFIKDMPPTCYLFFKYQAIGHMFSVVARILEKAELDKYLDYAETSLAEDAQEQQALAKAKAPKEEPHTSLGDCDCGSGKSPSTRSAIDTSMRKSDKKLSASSLEEDHEIDMDAHNRRIKKLRTDVLEEEMSAGARELATYADNHAQLHRTSHQPIVKNLQRKSAKGTYDHEKAKKLWGYHAKRASDAYHKEFGHKFSKSERDEAASHMADNAKDDHNLKEGYASIGHPFDWAGDVNRKARFYGKKPKATTTKNDEKDDTYKGSKQGGRAEVEANKWQKHRLKEEQLDELKKSTLKSYIKKAKSEVDDIKHFKKNPGQYPAATSDDIKSAERREKTREKGISKATSKLAEEETISEKAPPGAKFERMVKHIKKGYSKDGLTKKEKGIAYATAWKAKKREEQGE